MSDWTTALPTPDWTSANKQAVLYCGDCREILPQLPTDCIDAVVTDPPYGVGLNYGIADDDPETHAERIVEWFEVMCRWPCAVTPGIANIGHWPQPRWALAWLKKSAMGASRLSGPGAVSRNLWEPVLWYGSYPANPPSRDIIHAEIVPREVTCDHPCPKPLGLMVPLVTMACHTGQTICDPFTGSGTTGVACVRTGRRFIGIELRRDYVDMARDRIAREIDEWNGGPLFLKHAPAPMFK